MNGKPEWVIGLGWGHVYSRCMGRPPSRPPFMAAFADSAASREENRTSPKLQLRPAIYSTHDGKFIRSSTRTRTRTELKRSEMNGRTCWSSLTYRVDHGLRRHQALAAREFLVKRINCCPRSKVTDVYLAVALCPAHPDIAAVDSTWFGQLFQCGLSLRMNGELDKCVPQ